MNKSNYFAAVPVFAKLLQITLHYETRKLDTGNKMRKPEHINIYIIVRMIFFSCANPPTALFILINSRSGTGRSCETEPWGFLSLTQFLPFEKIEGFRREEDEQTRGRRAAALRPLRPQPSAQASGRRAGRAYSPSFSLPFPPEESDSTPWLWVDSASGNGR